MDEDKLECPKCEKGELQKQHHLLVCDNCKWSFEYNHYKDLKKLLDGKVFLEGDTDE
jgi:hypothetical protein